MSNKIYLAMAIHNHQPVGNFEWVFEVAYQKSYLPMLEALERHPKVRLALHNTGSLLDWLVSAHPEYIERLSALAVAGQVEVMAGAYYEPILVSLSDADKAGQLHKLVTAVKTHFHYEATGAWLAERIWEPHLPKPLAEAGIEYIVVDDTHLRYAGKTDAEMYGYYITEEQGYPLKVFASSKFLRYAMPWVPAKEVLKGLQAMAEETSHADLYRKTPRVAVMGDDGEKFGLWPHTYRHCWTNGWVEDFFTALEANTDWVETIPPGHYARDYHALGSIYMTAASYDEMTEWALPPQMTATITQLKRELQQTHRADILQFLKGGLWRGFMTKYAEVNQMHKKALTVSRKVHQMPAGADKQQALEHLWAAQCNCGYWHGLFGGIYLFHIRGANYRNLITAETLADRATYGNSWVQAELTDFNRDSFDELLLSNDHQWLCFELQNGGSLVEWDWRDAPYNLLNSMTRYVEGYHADLKQAAQAEKVYLMPADPVEAEQDAGMPEGFTMVKALGLENRCHYDWYRRAAFQDHFFPTDTSLADFSLAQYIELGDFLNMPYTVALQKDKKQIIATLMREGIVQQGDIPVPVTIKKVVTLHAGSHHLQVAYTITNEGDTVLDTHFGIENNLGLEGGQDPLTYFVGLEDDAGNRRGLGEQGSAFNISEFSVVSDIITVRSGIEWQLSAPANLWFFPFASVTNSESGYEPNYQGTSIMAHWALRLAPSQSWQVTISSRLFVTTP